MNRANITVVIPTYNRATVLSRAINSVRSQTLKPLQIIVVDDGSTDDTPSVLAALQPGMTTLQLDNNRGVSVARNAGVSHANGDIVAFLDSDDEWKPSYLEQVWEAWRSDEAAALVYTHYVRVQDKSGRAWAVKCSDPAGDQGRAMLLENFVHSSSLFSVRRTLFEQCGVYDPRFRIMQDRDLYMRLLERGPARLVPAHLVRRHVGLGRFS